MTKTLELIFDFGSPNAYFSWRVLPGILERTGATLEIFPALLGGIFKMTNNQPPMMAFAGIKNKNEYQMLEIQRFIKKYGLSKFTMNPHFPVNTVQIMRGAIVAQMDGELEAYVEPVIRAMWEDGKKMDDPEVIAPVLAEAGLDAEKYMARIQEDDVKEKLKQNTANAVERGVFGIPSFFVDGEMWFGKDRLADVEEALAG